MYLLQELLTLYPWFITLPVEDLMTEKLAIIDGYRSFFSYCKTKAGYSGRLQLLTAGPFYGFRPFEFSFFTYVRVRSKGRYIYCAYLVTN